MTSKSLTEALSDLRAKLGEPFKSLSDGVVQRLIEAQSSEHALKPGDKCPVFAMPTAEGAIVTSADLLAKGPLILSFYRGKCTFGNSQSLNGKWSSHITREKDFSA